jgi:hypothetical protein
MSPSHPADLGDIAMFVTLFIISSLVFIGLLAAFATWAQKRNPPREDEHREMMGGTQNDLGGHHNGMSGPPL